MDKPQTIEQLLTALFYVSYHTPSLSDDEVDALDREEKYKNAFVPPIAKKVEAIIHKREQQARLDEQYTVLGWFEDEKRPVKPVVAAKQRIESLRRSIEVDD